MELRPGYKRTEVGVIPEEWDCVFLDEVARRGSGHTPSKSHPEYWNGNVQWISLADSTNLDRLFIDDTFATITELGLANSSAVLHPPGTVVLSRDAGVGKSAIMRSEMAVSQHFMAWLCGKDLDNRYLYYWLQARKGEFERIANGSTIKTIGLGYFEELKVSLPKVDEQRAIATALSDVDALLTQLDRLIAKKRDIKQAAMQQLLTGKTRLPGFGGDWAPLVFDDVLERLNAKNHQIQTAQYQAFGRYPVVDQGQEPVVGYSDDGKRRFRCPQSGVIVFGDHTCIVKFVDFDFLVGADGTQLMQARAGHCTRFLAYLLLLEGVQQTGYNRHFKYLKERSFKTPVLNEQTAIATILSDLDAELAALEARRDKTRALKQGMMQELLTGRTRLV